MSIKVYSRSGCPYCDKIKTVLNQKELQYTAYELDEDFTRDEFYAEFGAGTTFPQVIYNEQKLGGCSDAVNYFIENNII
jgi:glutaredoxin 3